jgi:lipoic acid synthetase
MYFQGILIFEIMLADPLKQILEKNPQEDSRNFTLPKPAWIRVKAPTSKEYEKTRQLVREHNLKTVCEEAACPNIGECWTKKHATFMILGEVCTRACSFCNVKTGRPDQLDPHEPERVAAAVLKLNLTHVVVTSVDRDDLEDGGALHFCEVIKAIRLKSPATTVEVLTPDFLKKEKEKSINLIIEAFPDVFNHNMETVARLYPRVRKGARYFQSLSLLKHVKDQNPKIITKSGIMVGLGETQEEVYQLMDDLRVARVDFMTIGQYLQPSLKHYPVQEYVPPSVFELYAQLARGKGFSLVASSPLTRSSFHAGDDFEKLRNLARLKEHV